MTYKNPIVFLLCVLLLFFGQLPAFCQDNPVLHGKIFTQKDHQPIPFVSIIIKNKNLGGASDTEGRFNIKVSAQDTLIFSAVGYKKTPITISDQMISSGILQVRMAEDSLMLENVNVYSNGNQPRVYRAKANDPYYIPGIGMQKKPKKKPGLQAPKDPNVADYALGMISNPLSTIQNAFSKEAKEKRKMQHVLYQEAVKKKKQSRYDQFASAQAIQKLFDIDSTQANAFLEFYHLPLTFVMNNTDAEITIALMDHYGQFLNRLKMQENTHAAHKAPKQG
ncbi:carboxypeptidase-like regulatory domain-containing protein [Persicobacter psychrovividus]|uniref:Carboxypeptidase-like regulatory domain-containing protein n=1 Tax=Persicobacter psychrovividus TaxID=387638 RepID=A0ABM7VJC8_9BACT|nr:hypothetical protein PEPS_33800 [Persicobacter psychrovividus]